MWPMCYKVAFKTYNAATLIGALLIIVVVKCARSALGLQPFVKKDGFFISWLRSEFCEFYMWYYFKKNND